MRWKSAVVAAMLLCCVRAASAHRLDEYLQGTILSIEKDRVEGSMRLIPGVAVASSVIAQIDMNGDGILSEAEQRAYAEQVLGDLSVTMDGIGLRPKLVSVTCPPVQEMQEGLGEIHIQWTVELPDRESRRTLVVENHHRTRSSVYLMNTLVPGDRDVRIVAQKRNEEQSIYEVDYEQSGVVASGNGWTWFRSRLDTAGLSNLFRLGMKHIAEGPDHLLFLLALLLPAPLLVSGSRWSGVASVRDSLLRILTIVTAFTLGHSITLALATVGFVHVASRPVEVLIAVSILVSALHALRPPFPGKEAGIAAFFGLIHGLAFAATLGSLGLGRWERLCGIVAFNCGIETMQMIVVLAILPSLLLMSRTPAYSFLRIGGAVFAGLAALGWVVERLFQVRTSVDAVVNTAAQRALWIAGALFLASLGCWASPVIWTLPRRGRFLGWGRGVR